MREPQRRFQAFFVGKANYFFTKTIFFVDSLAPYVHFHKENGFPFTRKPWVGTGFLGVSKTRIYSNPPEVLFVWAKQKDSKLRAKLGTKIIESIIAPMPTQ